MILASSRYIAISVPVVYLPSFRTVYHDSFVQSSGKWL
jgi:hypothetical protein